MCLHYTWFALFLTVTEVPFDQPFPTVILAHGTVKTATWITKDAGETWCTQSNMATHTDTL